MTASNLVALTVTLLVVGACDRSSASAPAPDLTGLEAETTRSAVGTMLTEGERIEAICGPARGKTFSVDYDEQDWTADQISDGRVVLVTGPSNSADVIFRGATGSFKRAAEDGGDVSLVYRAPNNQDISVVVSYPSTGVTETHNVTGDLKGRRIDVWTSNKPIAIGSAKVAAFVSKCV